MTATTTAPTTVTPGRSRGFASLSTAMFKSFYRDWLSVGFSVFQSRLVPHSIVPWGLTAR